MLMRCGLILALVLPLASCTTKVQMMTSEVPVQGKLTLANGSALGDVVVQIQPLEVGHGKKFKVDAEGNFKGETVPGKYVYYIVPIDDEKAQQDSNYQQVPEAFRDSDMNRTIVIQDGSPLNIVLN